MRKLTCMVECLECRQELWSLFLNEEYVVITKWYHNYWNRILSMQIIWVLRGCVVSKCWHYKRWLTLNHLPFFPCVRPLAAALQTLLEHVMLFWLPFTLWWSRLINSLPFGLRLLWLLRSSAIAFLSNPGCLASSITLPLSSAVS